MKESNEYLEVPHNSIECLNYRDQLGAAELGRIIDMAGKQSAIGQDEIRELTKIILKIDPAAVDASMQEKFNKIMHKVKAQYA